MRLAGSVEPAPYPCGVRLIVQPRQVGLDECFSRFAGGGGYGHRAPEVGLKPRFDGAPGNPADAPDRLRMLNNTTGHVRSGFEGTLKRLAVSGPGRLDDPGKGVRVRPDQPHTVLPDAVQPAGARWLDDQFLKESGRQPSAERRDAASTDPGTPAGDLPKELLE